MKEAGDKITPSRETTVLDTRHLTPMLSVTFFGLPVSLCQTTHQTYLLSITDCLFPHALLDPSYLNRLKGYLVNDNIQEGAHLETLGTVSSTVTNSSLPVSKD